MAVTESNYTVSNSSTTNYSFTFPYLKTTDVKLSINGVASSAFTFANATTIQLNSNPTVGDKLRIYRDTDDSKLEAEFFAGSAIKSSDLNDNFNQNLYVTQESNNKIDAAWTSGDETIDNTETWASNNTRIATTGAIDARVDSKIDTALTTDVAAGNKITVTDNSPGSGQITLKVTSGSLVNSDVNASAAIAGTKISPDFGSQNIATTGTVDGRDVSADGIKLDSIETGATADQNASEIRSLVESASDSNVFTDADHTKLNAIEPSATADQTDAEIRAAVEAASDSNVFTDADHTKLNAIEANATADQTVTEIKSLIAGSPLGPTHLAESYYTETELNAGQLDNRYYTETESDARYFNISTGDTIKDGDTFPDNDTTIATTAAINDRIIDLVDDVGGFVPIANETSFPNANPDVNNGTGTIVSIGALAGNLTSNGSGVITIANGTVGNSTVTITGAANSTTYSAGYGLLVETTSTLNTYTFHRLSSKATEVSTVAGNISNINAVANNASNINSAVSNASNINSAVSNASNINSAVSNASNINTVAGNNTNINTVAGANSNITTVAGSISNVNTAAGSIANINTVATNISNVNDFSDKYRVASSAPTSSLDTGDLYFDTSANELKVYNGSAWQGGVTATGNLAGLGANTFTGNQSLGDDLKVQLGTGNDLGIWHNGTNSHIRNDTGDLILDCTSSGVSSRLRPKLGEEGVVTTSDGLTALYYDGSKKFETTSSGIDVTGSINATGQVKINDSFAYIAGTGNDLQIYHDGSNSYILNTTGELQLRDESRIKLRTDQFVLNNHANDESIIYAAANGAVELYYDGVKKLETTASGFTAYGDASTGSSIQGDLRLKAADSGTTLIHWNPENSEIRWDDNYKASFGDSADLQIFHNGSHSYIDDTGTGNLYIKSSGIWLRDSGNGGIQNGDGTENHIQWHNDGNVELYYDGSKKVETYSSGIKLNGTSNVWIQDSGKLICGGGSDLQIYHDGSHSYINDTGTGRLYINASQINLHNQAVTENMLKAVENGAVELYYDNSKKLSTSPPPPPLYYDNSKKLSTSGSGVEI